MDLGNLQGLIPICGGLYLLYVFKGPLPEDDKRRQQAQAGRDRFGPYIPIMVIGTLILGIGQLFGFFGGGR